MSELMYQDTVVVTLKDERGVPCDIEKIMEPGLLPFSLSKKSSLDFNDIMKWLNDRGIPKNREGISQYRELYPKIFQSFHYMSLDDPFWIRRRQFDKWQKLGFYNRHYDSGFGDLMFAPYKARPYSIRPDSSPDLFTGGKLKKCWRQDKKDNSYLIKAGSVFFKHEPLSEVIASVFLEKLNLMPYVRYDLCEEGNVMCSKCANFISPGEELVTADRLFSNNSYDNKKNAYLQLTERVKELSIPGACDYIDKVIFFDELIGNTERALNDIAFIYLPEKKCFKGPAPLFDNGSSFFSYNTVIQLEEKSSLFGDVSDNIYKKVLSDRKNIKDLLNDKSYKRIITLYPDITEKTAGELIEMIDERMDVFNREKNVEKNKKRQKVKSFAAVNISSLSNINTEFNRDR